jgi:hypothetical protein
MAAPAPAPTAKYARRRPERNALYESSAVPTLTFYELRSAFGLYERADAASAGQKKAVATAWSPRTDERPEPTSW